MAVRGQRKHTRRTKDMIVEDILQVTMMEMETENLSLEVYRYSTAQGINVVYYIFDYEHMENLIFKPMYLNKTDIHLFGLTENELYQKVFKNTYIMSRPRIMPFPEYLKDLEKVSENALIPIIRGMIGIMERIQSKNLLWCVTNILGERGAVCAFYKDLLRNFCITHNCRYLLLGFNNNDYTFLSIMNENTLLAMNQLTDEIGSVRSDTGRITQKALLVYNFRDNTLKEFEKMDIV